jgi:hypothetical protein
MYFPRLHMEILHEQDKRKFYTYCSLASTLQLFIYSWFGNNKNWRRVYKTRLNITDVDFVEFQ